jgi:hypothetical protein
MAYRELSHREKVADSSARVTALKQIGEALAKKAGVVSHRIKVGAHQLAWIQDSAVGDDLFAVRLLQYCAGVWRLTDRYQPEVPKNYWAGERSCHLIRGVQGFEWSCLIEEFNVEKSASLIHSMVRAKPTSVSVWFYTTGKKIKGIKKVGRARFAYSSS